MKFKSNDFRLREGNEVNLKKWPTRIDPVYKSKAHYENVLEQHIEQLSAMQQLHYSTNRHALLLIF
jgi:hypothetical protein